MIKKLNVMVKKLDVYDIGLTKLAVLFAAIIIVKLFPQLLHIRYSALLVIVVVLAIRPVYRFLFGK